MALEIPQSENSAVATQRKQTDALKSELRKVQKSISKFQAETKASLTEKKKDKKYRPDAKQATALRKSLGEAKKKASSLQRKIKSLAENDIEFMAMGVREGKVADSPIYVRGEVTGRKGTAMRGFLTILESDLEQQFIENGQSGRKELADWIIAPENPMTAPGCGKPSLASFIWQRDRYERSTISVRQGKRRLIRSCLIFWRLVFRNRDGR